MIERQTITQNTTHRTSRVDHANIAGTSVARIGGILGVAAHRRQCTKAGCGQPFRARRPLPPLERTAATREPVPDLDETRRRLRTGQALATTVTVGEWLDMWIAGDIRLDRLRVIHVLEIFNSIIIESDAEVEESNAQRRAALAELAILPRRWAQGLVWVNRLWAGRDAARTAPAGR
jgi:hypothetical protein